MSLSRPLVRIASFPTRIEASLARGALEQIGIPAVVPGEAVGTLSLDRSGMATGDLLVAEADRVRATAALRRMNFAIVRRAEL
jgi:hypothetical protein